MKAYTKDIIKTIIKGKKRFLAFLLITSLGVCMMSGLKAACDDLRLSADAFFDEQNMFDISIVSTLGLKEEDVKVLTRLPGIEDVEGAYSENVFTLVDGKTKQAEVRMLSEKGINVPYLVDGKYPTQANEILVTNKYLNQSGKTIGDIVLIEEKTEESDDEDTTDHQQNASEDSGNRQENNNQNIVTDEEGNNDTEKSEFDSRFELNLSTEEESEEEITSESEATESEEIEIEIEEEEETPNFLYTEYKISGVVVDTLDVNSAEGGVSFRSNSSSDYTFFVLPEAIESEVYTTIYLTLLGTDDLLCYSEEYTSRVDEIVTILEEEVKADREKSRYEEITGEAHEKLDDAEVEMHDKFEEIAQQILDAKIEIEDGWTELLDGQKELLDGEKQIAEAKKQLENAEVELKQGEKELVTAEKELKDAWKELESGEQLLAAGGAVLEETKAVLDKSEQQLEDAIASIPEQFQPMRDILYTQIASAEASIQESEQRQMELEAEAMLLREERDTLVAKQEDGSILLAERVRLLEVRRELLEKEAGLALRKEEVSNLNKLLTTYDASLKEIDKQEASAYQQIEDAREELVAGRAEFDVSYAEYEQNKATLEDGRKQLEEAQAEFEKGKQEIADGWLALEDGKQELEIAERELEAGRSELEEGKVQFEEGKQQYESSVSEFQDKRQEAFDKIAEAREEISELKMTEWYVTTRTASSGYINIQTDADCIESLGDVFPILFLTVAILISLTTISRMVEEDRGLIGTYKALGFTNQEIRRKYVVYALLASVCGGILGDILGFVVLPTILFSIFGIMYDIPEYFLAFNWLYGIGGILLFVIGIGGAAIASCSSALSYMPAVLMRPKAPKNGSRVLLERVTPIWSRLSFLNKVTARNLFRYKKRLFMTLFGIAGCTALLLGGYTIKDTITEMMPLQFEKTMVYDLMVVSTDNEKMLTYIEGDSEIRSYINPMITNVKVINEKGREETVQLIVVPDGASLDGYINLYDKKDNSVSLTTGDVFTTINVANILGYGKGDTVSLQTMDLETADVEVTEIVMNYLSNYVFMNASTYESYFDTFEPNAMIMTLASDESKHEAYAEQLAVQDGILSVVASTSFGANFDDAFRVINLVVIIVIVLAAALAFVVLFTLSTTNISERERELATIKVLGFFDKEVHLYVNKETIILTGLGILIGMPLGKVLGMWLMSVLDMPSIYFADRLYPSSYLIAGVMTIIFAVIVNFITDRTLDKINPVEALKSIE